MKDIVHTARAFGLNEGLLRQWTANSYTSDMIKQATFLSNMPIASQIGPARRRRDETYLVLRRHKPAEDNRSATKQSATSRSFDSVLWTPLRTKYLPSRLLRAGPISFAIFNVEAPLPYHCDLRTRNSHHPPLHLRNCEIPPNPA